MDADSEQRCSPTLRGPRTIFRSTVNMESSSNYAAGSSHLPAQYLIPKFYFLSSLLHQQLHSISPNFLSADSEIAVTADRVISWAGEVLCSLIHPAPMAGPEKNPAERTVSAL